MLTAGFIVLLIMLRISSNRMLMESQQTTYESEAIDIAADLANSLLTEATKKSFDEKVDYTVAQSASNMTSVGSLGSETGESFSPVPDVAPFQSVSKYDDVDDYKGYRRTVDSQTMKGFLLTADVYYVTQSNTDQASSSQTFFKRIDVRVTHPTYIPNGFTLSRIMTY